MPQAGDVQTAALTVTPADGSTEATFSVRSPSGTVTTPTATANADRTRWTVDVPYPVAGVYTLTWNVLGTGAGVEQYRVSVAPLLPGPARTYATSTDLANALHAAPPVDADEQLRDATRELDYTLRAAIYDVDGDGEPTDPEVIAALRDACCAVVQWWDETGDPLATASAYNTVSIGSVTLSRTQASGATPSEVLGRRALQYLRDCPGLLFQVVVL